MLTRLEQSFLTDESAIRDSIEYFESVKRMGTAVFQAFDSWLQSAQFKLQDKLYLAISLHPEDSISNNQSLLQVLEGVSLNLALVPVSHSQAPPQVQG